MKILTMCQRGNCRSVALAYVFKDLMGHDAISCGWQSNSRYTLEMLFKWAERIIVLEGYMVDYVIDAYRPKVSVYDVGHDRWFAQNAELIGICKSLIANDPLSKMWAA
jgi:predicted protein tyrosine phosphatase